MRYNIDGLIVRAENAAKPHTQRSRLVVDYLRQLGLVGAIMDFGCGKLRYGDVIIKAGKTVTFVDSSIQISRVQSVRGCRTSVSRYVAKNYPHAKVISLEEIGEHKKKYDVVTCLNVLSAIPCPKALRHALQTMRRVLKRSGMAVFVNQHKNSYFARYRKGKPHMFGYIRMRKGAASYYGILDSKAVGGLLLDQGFDVRRSWTVGEINFVEARPR